MWTTRVLLLMAWLVLFSRWILFEGSDLFVPLCWWERSFRDFFLVSISPSLEFPYVGRAKRLLSNSFKDLLGHNCLAHLCFITSFPLSCFITLHSFASVGTEKLIILAASRYSILDVISYYKKWGLSFLSLFSPASITYLHISLSTILLIYRYSVILVASISSSYIIVIA